MPPPPVRASWLIPDPAYRHAGRPAKRNLCPERKHATSPIVWIAVGCDNARSRRDTARLRPSTLPGAMSRTLLVSPAQRGAYATIGDALAAATDDSVIAVAPGTYPE